MHKTAKNELFLFHSIPFAQIQRALIKPDPSYADQEFLPAYRWLETQIGFYPLFLGMSRADDKRVFILTGRPGEHPNLVVFGFSTDALADICFVDDQWWNIVLGDVISERDVGPQKKSSLFKPSWTPSKWRCQARIEGHSVQALGSALDLGRAQFAYAGDEMTQEALLKQGFKNVFVKRLKRAPTDEA